MLTVGIDLGIKTTRVVILNNDKIIAHSAVLTGWEPQHAGESALTAALTDARVLRDDIARIVATGAGRQAFPLASHNVTEVTADARALAFLHPRVRTAIDVGAEEARAFKISGGRVHDFAVNEKCAAGAGVFIETMARTLELSLDEMSVLAQQASGTVTLNSQCTVFAESEVVSLIHTQTPRAEIARAVFASIAARVATLARRVGIEAEIALVGGLARSAGFVHALERELGVEILVPQEAEFIGALGAALMARDAQ
jgi:benzoyl-CoA reductase subunit D